MTNEEFATQKYCTSKGDLIKDKREFTFEIIKQFCNCLAVLLCAKITHKDLHGNNIKVRFNLMENGDKKIQLKLVDFGNAKFGVQFDSHADVQFALQSGNIVKHFQNIFLSDQDTRNRRNVIVDSLLLSIPGEAQNNANIFYKTKCDKAAKELKGYLNCCKNNKQYPDEIIINYLLKEYILNHIKDLY